MRLAVLALPLLLLIPALSALGPLWDRWHACGQPSTLCWPVGDAGSRALRHDAHGSGVFGSRRRGARIHNGIDLVASVGTPVRAAQSGQVRDGRQRNGLGTYLEVHHAKGYVTVYGHLSRVLVADGQGVQRGEVIGLVGKSGNARARAIQPHLHFELRLQGVPLDPLDGDLEGTP